MIRWAMKDVAFLKMAALLGVSLFVLIACGYRMATPEVRLEGKAASGTKGLFRVLLGPRSNSAPPRPRPA